MELKKHNYFISYFNIHCGLCCITLKDINATEASNYIKSLKATKENFIQHVEIIKK